MRILILTSHRNHSAENSVYILARHIAQQSYVSKVCMATLDDTRNSEFFFGANLEYIHAIEVNSDTYYPQSESFKTSAGTYSLHSFDGIFIRMPRPIPEGFFGRLENSFDAKKIVNRPRGILKTSNKKYLLNFKSLTPVTELCDDWESLIQFFNDRPTVLKPLESYAGKGILRIIDGLVNDGDETLTLREFEKRYMEYPKPYLAMEYLHNVNQGDKRIVVAWGQIMLKALRMPTKGGWLCNIAQGGSSYATELSREEHQIIDEIDPILRREGIYYYGLDTLVNNNGLRVVSEINTLSIGGFMARSESEDHNASEIFAELLVKHFKSATS